MSNIQKSFGIGSGWIIDSVLSHNVNISKYNPLVGNSYIKLPKGLNYPRKSLINIQNFDVNLADHHPARITKNGRTFEKRLDFKYIKFPDKIRDIYKTEKCVDLFLLEEKDKKSTILSLKILTHSFTSGKKAFLLLLFSTEGILRCHTNDRLKINGKQKIKMLKKVNKSDSKIMKEK